METIEERVAFLEGRVGEHSRMIDGIRAALVSLEQRMDRRFEALEDKIDRRFAATDQQIARQFIRVVGVQVTTFAALVAAILGAILVR